METKRFLAFVLALSMVICMMPFSVFALNDTQEEVISGQCGENVFWTYDKDGGKLIISGTGDMYDYDYTYGQEWETRWGTYGASRVEIQSGVTSIGNNAFRGRLVKEVSIPRSVTRIGESAFSDSGLENLQIPEGVITICDSAFFYTRLTEVYIPASVTSIGSNSFYSFQQKVFVVDKNNSCYSDIDGVLFNKSGTRLIRCPLGRSGKYTVPDGVITIENDSFLYCDSLTEIFVPDSVQHIGAAFSYCENMEKIRLPEDFTDFENISFYCCYSLTDITIPVGTEIIGDGVFANCASFTDVVLPVGVKSIGMEAFAYLSLSSMVIPYTVTSIGIDAFYCSENMTIKGYPGSYIEQYANQNNFSFTDISGFTSITLDETKTVVIDKAGGEKLFNFTPEKDGTYVFCSTKDAFLQGDILDASYNVLSSSNEDVGAGFEVKYQMTAGTEYILRAKYSSIHESGSFNVHLEMDKSQTKIELISAVAVKTLSEGENGYLASDYTMEGQTPKYFKYNLSFDTLEYTVTYDGGKTFTGNQNDIQQRFGNNQSLIDVSTDQSYDNQWGVGKHTVNINFMGKECTTEVEIVKCPIDSISAVAVKVLTEGVDGWMTSDWNMDGQSPDYFKYNTNYDTLEYTVTYDGGKTFTGNQDEIQRKFGNSSSCINVTDNQSYANQWSVGEHEVIISFLGKSCIVEIEVVKSPIESIEVTANRPLLYQLDGHIASDMGMDEYFKYEVNDSIFQYNVKYDGGKTFEGNASEIYSKFSCSPMFFDDQSFNSPWGIGKHSVSVSIAGVSCNTEIEIVANPYKSLRISGENELLLTFTKHDNSTVTAKNLDFVKFGGGMGECGGTLTTDIGVFSNVSFSYYTTGDSEDNSRDLQLTIGTLQSNILAKNNWLKMREYSQRIAYYSLAFERDTDRNILDFNGRITNDNINSIISLSYDVTGKLWSGDKDYITEGEHTYFLFDLDDVKETVAMVFDTAGVDFSGAKNDAASGKVMVEDVAIGGVMIETNTTFDTANNCWNSTTEEYDIYNSQSVRRLLTITYDENNKVSSITETHDHKLIFHASVDASCENDGSAFYCECDICGKLFTDETCSETITKQDTIIQSTGHNYGDLVVPPTTTEQGYTEHRCSKCGHSYKDNFVDVLSPQIIVSSTKTTAGKQIEVTLSLKNNPGIAGLAVSLKYDASALTLIESKKGGMFSGFTAGKNFAWDESEDVTTDGTLATFVFSVADNAEPGDYVIEVIPRSCINENIDDVTLTPVNGVVTVIDFIYGDVNGDEKIDMKDVVQLRKYIANYDYDTETSSVAIEAGADANGDEKIDMKDVVLLRKYIVNYDYDTETSSIVLGPQ